MNTKNVKTAFTVVIILMLLTASCDENPSLLKSGQGSTPSQKKNLTNARIASYSFDGTEGDAIDLAKAIRWVANFADKNNNVIKAHFFGNKSLSRMLSRTGIIGLRFYYSKSDEGNDHLLVVPANSLGNDLPLVFKITGKNSSVDLEFQGSPNAFSGAESDSLASETAKHFVTNYNADNAEGIQAHFFGFQIINQLLSETNCVGIRCYYALDDAGVQQLLLVGVSNWGANILPASALNGRVSDSGGTIADVSSPCPAYCSN